MRAPANFGLFFTFGFLFIQSVGGEFQIADSLSEGEISQLLSPIYEATQQLKDLVSDFEFKKKELRYQKELVLSKLSKSTKDCLGKNSYIFLSWSIDDCVKFTDNLKHASDVIWNAGLVAVNVTQEASTIGYNILNCPGLNVYKAVKCYNENLSALKDLVNSLKDVTKPLIEECKNALQQTRLEFDYCVGIPVKSKITDNNIKNC